MAKQNAVSPSSSKLNPFDSTITLSNLQLAKVVILGVLLAPIRVLLTAVVISCGMLTGQLLSKGKGQNEEFEPFTPFTRAVQSIVRFLARVCYILAGFYHVTFKGKLAKSSEAPIVVIAPHTSWLDALIFGHLGLKSVVARAESEKSGIVAPIIRMFKPICVARTSKDSRLKTSEAIARRAKSGNWPATAIFPEGTCSNGKCLISFKMGAFTPGVPVQPVLIRYKNKHDYLSWSFKGCDGFKSAFILYSQFINFMEIEALPVYSPSEEERNDPSLFANNVRAYMARHLDLPVCNYTFEDGLLMQLAGELRLPDDVGLIELETIKNTLGFDFNAIKLLLRQFASIDNDRDGFLTKEDLAVFCHVSPDVKCISDIYAMYDRDQAGKIDFKQFLCGRCRIIAQIEDHCLEDMTFTLMDADNKGLVTLEQFHKVMSNSYVDMEKDNAETIYKKFCKQELPGLCRESYKEMLVAHPEYAIFIKEYQL